MGRQAGSTLQSEILDIHHPGNIFLTSFPAIWQTARRLTRETCRLGTSPGEYHGGGGGGGGGGGNGGNKLLLCLPLL